MQQQRCNDRGNTITFYLHCIHDMSIDYTPTMNIVKLDDTNYNKHHWDNDILSKIKSLHLNKGEQYPTDTLEGKDKDFIYKYYKKSCKTFGYKL